MTDWIPGVSEERRHIPRRIEDGHRATREEIDLLEVKFRELCSRVGQLTDTVAIMKQVVDTDHDLLLIRTGPIASIKEIEAKLEVVVSNQTKLLTGVAVIIGLVGLLASGAAIFEVFFK